MLVVRQPALYVPGETPVTALPPEREARVTRLSDYDAEGAAWFRVEWIDYGLEQSQVVTATPEGLNERLRRNGFLVVKPQEVRP